MESLNASFALRTDEAKQNWIKRFMKQKQICSRAITHVGQQTSSQLRTMKADFVAHVNAKFRVDGVLADCEKKYIVNMDQTAIFFEVRL
jgi:hypothetical protein